MRDVVGVRKGMQGMLGRKGWNGWIAEQKIANSDSVKEGRERGMTEHITALIARCEREKELHIVIRKSDVTCLLLSGIVQRRNGRGWGDDEEGA
jgi:hypothetical protein